MSDPENGSGPAGVNAGDQTQTNTTTDTDQGKTWEESQGSGGKTAVLADLHRERTARQQLTTEIAELKAFKDGFTKLLGGGQEDLDPKELAGKLTASDARATTAEKLLDVYRATPAGADVNSLIDSMAFRTGLAGSGDTPTFIKQFLKDNPRFLGTSADTVKNLHRGNEQRNDGGVPTMNDLIRGN